MAASVLVDAGFVVALLSRQDAHHRWEVRHAERQPPPWKTCESVLSEAFHLLGMRGASSVEALLRRRALTLAFDLDMNLDAVLRIRQKYADVPASLADASLVRTTETLPEPLLLTTDADFRLYRRHGRQMVPCITPH